MNAWKLGQAEGLVGLGNSPVIPHISQGATGFVRKAAKLTTVGLHDEGFMKAGKGKIFPLILIPSIIGKHEDNPSLGA